MPSSVCLNSLKRTAPASAAAQRIARAQRRPRRSAARATSSGSGRHWLHRMKTRARLRPRLEGEIEHFAERHHWVEPHGIADVLRDVVEVGAVPLGDDQDRKSTRLNSSHSQISYAVFCLKKKNTQYATAAVSHTYV